MTREASQRAASDLLWQHWQRGTRLDALPADLRPADRAEGYAIQAHLEARGAKPLFGWKIAATSAAGQRHIGVDGPLAGRLLAERVHALDAEPAIGANAMLVIEPEFAFRIGRDLPARDAPYAQSEVMEAVADLHLALEIPDSRFVDFASAGAAQLIADDACAHEFVLGPAAAKGWRDIDLSKHQVQGTVTGKLERQGSGANVLGDPRLALTWLANELSGLGLALRAGQVVTTGTCLAPLPIAPGDQITADYGTLGRTSLRFAGT
ncbi:MAG: 2-keto-4-pentenoate hydratase [Alphaproteobacteria bacterium]